MDKPFKVRDRRNKGWFYMDNEYLNGLGKHIGVIGIAVYVSLCRHADNEQKCFPAQELIAEELGIGTSTVKKYIGVLRKHNVISVERVKKGRKWSQNLYWLLDKAEWIYPKKVSGLPDTSDVQGYVDEVSGLPNEQYQGYQVSTKDTNKKETHITIPIGEFQNVKLSLEEIEKLKVKVPNYDSLVEELSQYLASSGKKYNSHYATLLNWARRKGQESGKYNKTITLIGQ